MWDDAPPYCRPVSPGTQYVYEFNGHYVDDAVIRARIEDVKNNLQAYTGTVAFFPELENYDGKWTNRSLIPRSYCEDHHSGCANPGMITHTNILLKNRQKEFYYQHSDKVHNTSQNMCTTALSYPKNLKRTCQYTIIAEDVKKFRDTYGSQLSSDDRARLNVI